MVKYSPKKIKIARPGVSKCMLLPPAQTLFWCHTECPTENIDMMFVIDGSDSVKKENFQKVKSWIQRVVQDFDTANRTQVGVVSS